MVQALRKTTQGINIARQSMFMQPKLRIQAGQNQLCHQTMCFSQVNKKANPKYEDRISTMPLKEYFDDLLKRRPENKSGYIDLPKNNFTKMVKRVQSEEDFLVCKDAIYQYIGHRNTLDHSSVDLLLMKALELGKPELSFELLRNHAELLYHPRQSVISSYLDYFRDQEDFEPLKQFFIATKSRYMI